MELILRLKNPSLRKLRIKIKTIKFLGSYYFYFIPCCFGYEKYNGSKNPTDKEKKEMLKKRRTIKLSWLFWDFSFSYLKSYKL